MSFGFLTESTDPMRDRFIEFGIQPELYELLQITDKRRAARIWKAGTTLAYHSLGTFIVNAGVLGFSCRSKYRDHIPSEARLSEAEDDAFFNAGDEHPGREKARRKLAALFDKRKFVRAHLFENGTVWHVFYMSQRDVRGKHWKGGPHVHYASHAWVEQTAAQVWRSLDDREYNVPGAIHVPFDVWD